MLWQLSSDERTLNPTVLFLWWSERVDCLFSLSAKKACLDRETNCALCCGFVVAAVYSTWQFLASHLVSGCRRCTTTTGQLTAGVTQESSLTTWPLLVQWRGPASRPKRVPPAMRCLTWSDFYCLVGNDGRSFSLSCEIVKEIYLCRRLICENELYFFWHLHDWQISNSATQTRPHF